MPIVVLQEHMENTFFHPIEQLFSTPISAFIN